MEAIAGQFPAPEIASFTFFSLLAAEGARAQFALLLEHVILYPLVPDERLLLAGAVHLRDSPGVVPKVVPGGQEEAVVYSLPDSSRLRMCQASRQVPGEPVEAIEGELAPGAPEILLFLLLFRSTQPLYNKHMKCGKNSIFADESFFRSPSWKTQT